MDSSLDSGEWLLVFGNCHRSIEDYEPEGFNISSRR